ncbi:hypothetical protein [Akkermansia sp.]|uniref:hypothetical protein n=1 Tax=Akkermansia sp. TaxID=1872421 RepID=UPI003AB56F63
MVDWLFPDRAILHLVSSKKRANFYPWMKHDGYQFIPGAIPETAFLHILTNP